MRVAVGVGLGIAVIVGVFVAGNVGVELGVGVKVGVAANPGANTEQAAWNDSRNSAVRIRGQLSLFITFYMSPKNLYNPSQRR